MPGFEYAIALGVDALEFDVVVTKDDVVVVSHDGGMNPKFCRGPAGPTVIRELSFEELGKWDCGAVANPDFPKQKAMPGMRVPTLDEVLALAARGEFDFHIEIKTAPDIDLFAKLVWEQICNHKIHARVAVLSFDFRALHAMKRLDPSMRLCALYEEGNRDYPSIAREAGASIVSPHYETVTSQKVSDAHEAGLQVVAWTANTPAVWDKLILANVDAIVTDDPAGLIAYLRAKRS